MQRPVLIACLLVPLLAIPWLNPMVQGPVAPMLQTLVTVLCAVAFLASAGHTPSAFGKSFAVLVAGAWVLAAVLSAVAGLLQYFGVSAYFSPWVSYSVTAEAYGNLRQRNQFATLLNIGMAALLWSLPVLAERLQSAWSRPARQLLRGTVVAIAVLLAVALAASASRTGLVQLVLLVVLGLLWARRDARNGLLAPHWLLLVALLAYVVASQLLPVLAHANAAQSGIWSRLKPEALQCTSRVVLWSNVLQIIAQKPWWGWGPGELAFAHFDTLYSGPRFCEIMGNAHNLPLEWAVVIGVPGALLLLGGLTWLVLRARPWREADPDRRMAWAVLVLIGLHSMLEYPLWYAPFLLAVLLCLLLLCGARRRQAWVGSGAAQALVSVGFALCAYTTWDYWRISQIYLTADERAPAYRTGTLEKIQGSWLFRNQVRFAALGLTPMTPENAQQVQDIALDMLHFSPEPMVVEKVLESARLLGHNDLVDYYRPRFRAAYPDAYARWSQK